jgi:hypothetical protein
MIPLIFFVIIYYVEHETDYFSMPFLVKQLIDMHRIIYNNYVMGQILVMYKL